MLTTIKSTKDLLALRDAGGVIRIDGDLRIECDVPWIGAGEHVSRLRTTGNLDCRGNLYCGGNLDCWGYLYCRGYLYCGGNLDCRGNLYCGGNCAVSGDLLWSHASTPDVTGRFFHRLILPQEWQRAHWQERLGLDLGSGCYDEIVALVLPELPRLLRRKCWSSTERLILESLRLAVLDEPAWVTEMRASKEAANV